MGLRGTDIRSSFGSEDLTESLIMTLCAFCPKAADVHRLKLTSATQGFRDFFTRASCGLLIDEFIFSL